MTRGAITRALGRKFARVATNASVRNPAAWRAFRGLVRRQFDALAPEWNELRGADSFAPYDAALAAVEKPPLRALDLGTGTGAGAVAIARRFPQADVLGVDLSRGMIAEAERDLPEELRERVRFQVADASALPFADDSFDLVGLGNMIPFFDELARVLAPGGYALFSFSSGPATPIYVAADRLRAELSRRGFSDFADFAAGQGTAMLARKQTPS